MTRSSKCFVAAAVLALSACAPAVDPQPRPNGPAAAPTAPEDAPAPPARLVKVRESARGGDSFAALGLTGANKPNGLPYRLRQDVPQGVPAQVPREMDGLELWIAERTGDGWMAFYRGPLAGNADQTNVGFRVIFFRDGRLGTTGLYLNDLLSRVDHLEIQDVRHRDGKLYFNEACQSYAREADGACSSLVRMDVETETVDWRTPPRTSNNVFLLHGPYVVAGYGFTAEPDSLFLLDASTGAVVDRAPLDSAHQYLELVGDALHVVTHERHYVFRIVRA